jgi:hypothetical protein
MPFRAKIPFRVKEYREDKCNKFLKGRQRYGNEGFKDGKKSSDSVCR